MPTYTFLNKTTDTIEEHVMSWVKLADFKQDNPQLEQYFSAENLPIFGDGMRMDVPGIGQPDARFEREIIGRIKETVPGNRLVKSHKTKMPREW